MFQVSEPKSTACSQCVPSVRAQVYILLVFKVSEPKSTACSKCQSPSLQLVRSVFQASEPKSTAHSQCVPSVTAQVCSLFTVCSKCHSPSLHPLGVPSVRIQVYILFSFFQVSKPKSTACLQCVPSVGANICNLFTACSKRQSPSPHRVPSVRAKVCNLFTACSTYVTALVYILFKVCSKMPCLIRCSHSDRNRKC